jgi:hypothetical protein
MKSPKILIAAPICGVKQYSINYWFEWMARQTYSNFEYCLCVNGKKQDKLASMLKQVEIYHLKTKQWKKPIILKLPEADLSTIQNITYAREMIRRFAIKNRYHGILWLDTDTIPANKDAVANLLKWKKESVSGLYFYKESLQPVIVDLKTNTNVSMHKIKKYVAARKLLPIYGGGYGCVLHRENAMKCEFNYELFGEERTDDFGHCYVLEKNGIKRWCDPFILCKHFSKTNKLSDINKSISFSYASSKSK